MKPVEQTILTKGDGNCFSACLASILEMPLDVVPCYHTDSWHKDYENWLGVFGLSMLSVGVTNYDGTPWFPRGYAILAAQSPRYDCLHAVVTLDDQIVWDPHPGRDMGVGEWRKFTVFTVIDPCLYRRLVQGETA